MGVGRTIVVSLALTAALAVATIALSAVWPGTPRSAALGAGLGGFLVYARAGTIEELVFRWVIPFHAGWTPRVGMVVGTTLFAVLHFDGGLRAVVLTGVLGAILMAYVARTKDLTSAVLAHFSFDVLLSN